MEIGDAVAFNSGTGTPLQFGVVVSLPKFGAALVWFQNGAILCLPAQIIEQGISEASIYEVVYERKDK